MNEKLYKTMEHAGIVGIVTGIVLAVTSVASSVLLIVYGAKLLKEKKNVII
ncbi:MAG: hypothetical protein Q4F41_09180 [Eubacteriales bacterium]|nr:hypothetical protein [Eubacteriales bacterium]